MQKWLKTMLVNNSDDISKENSFYTYILFNFSAEMNEKYHATPFLLNARIIVL